MTGEDFFQKLKDAVLNGEEDSVADLVRKALDEGLNPLDILKKGLAAGVNEIADKFDKGEIYLPEVMMSADTFSRGEEVIRSVIKGQSETTKGTVVIGTAYGDIHDIGKTLVSTFLRVNEFRVFDLGTDVEPEKFIKACKENNADIVGVSTLLSSSFPFSRDVKDMLEIEGIREKTYFIVGGGSINPDRAKDAKADGYARYAHSAVELCEELISKRPKPPLSELMVKGE